MCSNRQPNTSSKNLRVREGSVEVISMCTKLPGFCTMSCSSAPNGGPLMDLGPIWPYAREEGESVPAEGGRPRSQPGGGASHGEEAREGQPHDEEEPREGGREAPS